MKNKFLIYLLLAIGTIFFTSTTGCSPKYGCPAYDSINATTSRKGELSKKKGNSNLFPKNMRKYNR